MQIMRTAKSKTSNHHNILAYTKFSYVKTCTRTRPCKHEHVWVVNTLRGNVAVEKNIGNYVVSCTQTRPPM